MPKNLPFVILNAVESTNNHALSEIRQGHAQNGISFFAHHQYAGRGQRQKVWIGQKNESLFLSMVLIPELKIAQQFELSICICNAVKAVLDEEYKMDIKIKWPNDIFINDRKAGGILIDNIIGKKDSTPFNTIWKWAVVGVGLNLNQEKFDKNLPMATSFFLESGVKFKPENLAKKISQKFFLHFDELKNKGLNTFYENYVKSLYKLNELVKFKKNDILFDAKIIGVSEKGKLMIKHSYEEEIEFGAIEWVHNF